MNVKRFRYYKDREKLESMCEPNNIVGTIDYSGGSAVTLSLDTEHPASHYGIGVLVVGPNPDDGEKAESKSGWVLDGAAVRGMRDQCGDTIYCKTDMKARVCAALGVPENEPGIEEAI